MATFNQIVNSPNLSTIRQKIEELERIQDFAVAGVVRGDGILDDAPLTNAQKTSIANSWNAKKAEIVAAWGDIA